MSTTLSSNPVADRAEEIFEAQIKPRVAGEDPNHFLAIDVDTGDYEFGPDDLATEDRLRARHPEAVIFVRRVGDEVAYSVGGGYQA